MMRKLSFAKICLLLAMSLGWLGFAVVGKTWASFVDLETSSGNTFTAATLDFRLEYGVDFFPNVTPSNPNAARDINVINDGSLGFEYTLQTKNETGDLCDYLNLTVTRDGVDIGYTGKLKDFSYDAGEFSAPEDWRFTASLTSGDSGLQDETCSFNFVFKGEQIGGSGFSDEEIVGNEVKAGYWDIPVVLNEFLPNEGNYPEYIELYNKTGSPIELGEFYVKADDNTIPIDISTTALYSGSSTEIPANGWLVITTGGNLIGDSSGTIALYNQNDVEVDFYSYGAPDHNINNNPGWTNNLVAYLPFDGDTQDLSGNANHGTNNGAVFSAGKINQALNFDGIDDYVAVSDSGSLDIANQLTVEGWINANSFAGRPTIAGKWRDINGANERGYLLTIATNGSPQFYISTTGSNYAKAGSSPLSNGQWYHLVGTYDGVNIKLYVNGVLSATTPQTGSIHLNNDPLLIGANDGWGGTTRKFTNGLIDEVKIYNRALSASEVISHYGQVPEDKSYARIPDGTGGWIDPVPTPGEPNRVEESNSDEATLIYPVINEVYYNVGEDKGLDSGNEWVEIYNKSDQPLDISGWKICDDDSCDTIPASEAIPAGGFGVITAENTTWDFWPSIPAEVVKILLDSDIGNGLSNEGDKVVLQKPDGTEIDAVSFGVDDYAFSPSCPNVAKGHSLVRDPKGEDTNQASNFIELSTPSPGEDSSSPEDEEEVDEVLIVNQEGLEDVKEAVESDEAETEIETETEGEGEMKEVEEEEVVEEKTETETEMEEEEKEVKTETEGEKKENQEGEEEQTVISPEVIPPEEGEELLVEEDGEKGDDSEGGPQSESQEQPQEETPVEETEKSDE